MTQIVEAKPHALLGPSGWDWWSNCPGAPVLAEGLPNVVSRYAAEGTVAHEIAQRCLVDDCDAETFVGQSFSADGYDFTVDMEMADAVNTYVAHVHMLVGDGILMPEQEVPIGHLTGERGATGTSDAVAITNGGTRMVVVDLKYGKGVQVWATNTAGTGQINGQGGMYALGALEKFGMVYEDVAEVEIVIVQPRLDHIDSVIVTVDELRAFGEEVTLAAGRVALAKAVDVAVNIEGIADDDLARYLLPGEKQCKFCNAKAICPALAAEVSSSMALVSAASPEEFEDLTVPKRAASMTLNDETDVDRLAAFMRAVPLIEEAIKAARAEVERRLFAGLEVPGWKIVQGKRGNRQWSDEAAAEAELKKRYKVDEMYDKKVISPSRAEKLMKDKPKVWAKIAPLIVQPEGKPSVAPESDPRPVYKVAAAIEDFADLTAADGEADALLG